MTTNMHLLGVYKVQTSSLMGTVPVTSCFTPKSNIFTLFFCQYIECW